MFLVQIEIIHKPLVAEEVARHIGIAIVNENAKFGILQKALVSRRHVLVISRIDHFNRATKNAV